MFSQQVKKHQVLNVGTLLAELNKRGQKLKQFIEAGNNPFSDEGIGEQLFLSSMAYFYELSHFDNLVVGLMKSNYSKQVSEGIFGLSLSRNILFGVTKSIKVTGVYIDVDRNVYAPASKSGDPDQPKSFLASSGMLGSFLENSIIEQLYGFNAISAVKALNQANASGLRTFIITSSNVSTVLPLLQASTEVKTDITNAVNTGKEVVIPESNIQVNNWAGIGYIILDLKSGSGAYIISGGIAGGSQTEEKGVLEIAGKVFALVFSLAALGGIFEAFTGLAAALELAIATLTGLSLYLVVSLLLFNVAIALIAAYLLVEFVIIPLNRELEES